MRKRTLIIVVVTSVILAGAVFGFVKKGEAPTSRSCNPGESLATTVISSDAALIRVEVAESGEEKAQGLSGRNCLDPDSGMLFAYDHSGDYCFWMKDMKFAIDMVWLDDEKKIVTIKDRVSPATYPESFCPSIPARYIVEVAAGQAADYGWQAGTILSF